MVLLPERLLKGPLAATQKTEDPSKRQMGESLSFSYLLSTKFDFPGMPLGSPGTAKGSYEKGTFVEKCPIPPKGLLFSGITTAGKGKPTVNCILLKGPKEVWQINERWQAAPELLEVTPHTNYGPTENGRNCPTLPKNLSAHSNSLAQQLPLEPLPLTLSLLSTYYLLACKLQSHRNTQNEQVEQLLCGSSSPLCLPRRQQTTPNFYGPLYQTPRAMLDSMLSARAWRSTLTLEVIFMSLGDSRKNPQPPLTERTHLCK